MAMLEFRRTNNAFNYVFEKALDANETVIVRIPPVSPNKRGVNDIGWQSDGSPTLYGTLSSDPEGAGALWQEIQDADEVNKTVAAIKIVNGSTACNIVIRAIFD